MATTEFAKTDIKDSTSFKKLKDEFGWVIKRLLKEFKLEQIDTKLWNYDHNLALAVTAMKNGKRFRNAIKLIEDRPEGEYRFDQTPKNEKRLETFIETFKA